MPIGPGKYDELCTAARKGAGAKGALLIIIGGDKGEGFSCQADAITTMQLPDILEMVAREIRASLREGKL